MYDLGDDVSLKFKFTNSFSAFLISANIPIVTSSICNGWSSAANLLLTSDKTPLPSGKITLNEASWIASLIYIGGLIGTFFFGYLSKRCGRKWLLISISTLSIVSENINAPMREHKCAIKTSIKFQIPWLLVYFAQNVSYLYASRAINGFFGGGINVIV